MAVIVNIPNAHDDNSQWNASGGYWDINIRTNDGYLFVGDIKAVYTNTSGYPKSVVLDMNGAKVWAFGELSDTDADTEITITGNTRSENDLEVINNIPNTTATGTKGSGYYDVSIQVTANEGYKITAAQVEFTDSYGYPDTKDLTISTDGKTASWEYDDADTGESFTLTGTTASEGTPELNVTNNITGSGVTEQHTFDGETATFTVTGKYSPNKVRFFDLKASYTNKAGTATKTPFVVQDLEYSQQATLTVTDIDPTKPVTLTGSYDYVVEISTNLSNCTANEDLPQYVKDGETVNVTLTANDGTEFDTEQSTPQFYYQNASGLTQTKDLTISSDKKTATGSIQVNTNWSDFAIIGSAYPVAVVGEQYGAINVYLVTLDELAEFSGKRFFKETGTDPSTGAPIYENIDLGAYVNKIRRVYTNIGASSTDVIRCGNYNTGVSCHQPAQDKITLDFGTAVVPAHNEDNTDYESEIQIFLPFAGFVNLNTDYAGKTIALQYVINVVTGNGVALLSCNGVVFQVEETEPSSEIIYLSPSTQVKTVGGDDWNEMLFYGLEPYIYCKWYESATGGRNNDRQTGILGDFRGFNVFDDVTPIHTAEMLTEEQEMIYTALSDGVYIE
ncbi:MAG: hypothetical protein [Bacteriophage sp.]|nr:MAG: hypothetical protein [Bacteriophage sp.]